MNTQKALEVLVNAVKLANTKGAFTLEDSKVIAEAVEVFTKPAPVEQPKPEEPTAEKKK